jgi:hypothetical protein
MLMKKPYLTRQVGLVCLVLSLVIGYFGPRTHLFAENWLDGIRGVFLGLAIGMLLLSLRRRTHP